MGPKQNSGRKVYFIRHKRTNSKSIHTENDIDDLKVHNKIGIFFENMPIDDVVTNHPKLNGSYPNSDIHYDPIGFNKIKNPSSKYESTYKSALRKIWQLGKDGGLVVSEYNNDVEFTIGEVLPNTRIETFIPNNAKHVIYVTLQLENPVRKEYSQYPVYLAVRPPYSTICNPKTPFFKDVIPAIYSNKPIPPKRKQLHYKMLEQMCVEYLRKVPFTSNQKLEYCILRPGKGAPMIDIAGVSTGGTMIYAQVKTDIISVTAHMAFIKFAKKNSKAKYIIFSEGVDNLKGKNKAVQYIDVDKVFDHFNNNKAGKDMINRMIGFS